MERGLLKQALLLLLCFCARVDAQLFNADLFKVILNTEKPADYDDDLISSHYGKAYC